MLPKGDEVDVAWFLRRLPQHRNFRLWEVDVEDVRSRLDNAPRASYAAAVTAAYASFAANQGKVRWGDKTPRYVESIPTLNRLFPHSQFIHLVRDGRNVALSYAQTDFGPPTLAKAARIWSRRVHAGMTYGRPLGSQRYLEVRYESLVADTETVVKTVCEFLGIPFEPIMMDEDQRAKGINKHRAGRFNPHVAKSGVKKTRSWQEQMPRHQVEVFEAVGGPLLSTFGYERWFPNPSRAAAVRARLGLVGLPVDRLKPTGSRLSETPEKTSDPQLEAEGRTG